MKQFLLVFFAIFCIQSKVLCQLQIRTTTGANSIITGSYPTIRVTSSTPQIFQETTTSEEPTTTEAPDVNPCEGHYGEIIPYPDPEMCNRFIVCALSIPMFYTCPPETIFDVSSGRCIAGECSSGLFLQQY